MLLFFIFFFHQHHQFLITEGLLRTMNAEKLINMILRLNEFI